MNKFFTLIIIALFSTSICIAKPIEKSKKVTSLLSLSNIENADQMVEFTRNLIQQVRVLNSGLTTPEKSAAFKQKLDSTVSKSGFPLEKEEFVYNSLGNCTLYTKKTKFMEEDAWVLNLKDEYTYNSAGFETLSSEWELNETNGSFENTVKTETTYNSNNQETIVIEWDNNNDSHTLMRDTKTETSYNVPNKIIMYGSTWDAATSSWVEKTKTEALFVNQRVTKHEVYNKSGLTTWSLFATIDFSYDIQGNVAGTVTQIYNTTLQKLVNLSKSEISYYASNLEKNDKTYMWDAATSKWDAISQYDYEYNTKGQTSKTTYLSKGFISQVLEISKVEEISFDRNFNPQSKIVSISDFLGGLMQTGKETYVYSTSYNFNSLVLPSVALLYFDDYFMNGRLDKVTEFAKDELGWTESCATNYYYSTSSITVGISKIENGVKIFPNPTTDFLRIEAGTNERIEYSLFDITGKNILSGSGNGSAQLSLKNRSRGIYFIDVKIENSVSKRMKIVKE